MSECIFCKIAAGQIPVHKIYKNKDFISFLDAHPVGEGHTLVVSKKHFDSMMDLNKEVAKGYISAVKDTAKILMKKYKADGFNTVINTGESAGQVIKHIHFHILPRKKGDNKRGIFIG